MQETDTSANPKVTILLWAELHATDVEEEYYCRT